LGPLDVGAILLLLAALIGFVNQVYVGIPRGIALLLGALAIALLFGITDHVLHVDLVARIRLRLEGAALGRLLLDGALAFLLFAASLHVDLGQLRRNAAIIATLATFSVILATIIFGTAIWGATRAAGLPIPLGWALVAGAILAPTDAVVVESLLRPLRLPPALKAAVSGESLFNDGAGVALFLIMLSLAQGAQDVVGHGRVALALLREIAGGLVLGAACGWVASLAMRRAAESAICLLISLALVLGTYRVALEFGISGPIAVVAAGLVVGRHAPAFMRDLAAEDQPSELVAFWSLVDELLNALLFLFMGFQVLAVERTHVRLLPVLIAIPAALLARFVSVAVPLLLIRGRAAPPRSIALLTWAGLRGGISVALALNLPDSPWRDQLLAICYGVVLFTVVVQGLSMKRVTRLLYGHLEPTPAGD